MTKLRARRDPREGSQTRSKRHEQDGHRLWVASKAAFCNTKRYACRMTTIALRLPDDLVCALDELIRAGHYDTRTDVLKAALRDLLEAHQRREIDRAIVEGYSRNPQTDDEVALAAAMTRALIEEEPW
jgi:Arc/MetJ-type ribon-helix-helix transcriptional regulator